MEIISEDKLRYLAGKHNFNMLYLEKDYFLTIMLYLLRDIKGLYFKGGTALNKIFFNHLRLSEDLDFTSRVKISLIKKALEKAIDKDIFPRFSIDNSSANFIRYHVFFRSYFEKESFIILDINRKASMHKKPEYHKVKNFYGLKFSIHTLNIDELVAEKLRSMLLRNQPRDYFDMYFILKKYKLDMSLANKKLQEAGSSFNVAMLFNNANKIFSRWEGDLMPITNRKIKYLTVIRYLQRYFKYKTK